MGIREKCLIHTDLKSDQIAILEKMVEHFAFLQPYYKNIVLEINGNGDDTVFVSSKDTAEIFSSHDGHLKSRSDNPRTKRIPLFIDDHHVIGQVVYEENPTLSVVNLDQLLDLCRHVPDSFHPTDYLVPDGLAVFDASGQIQTVNFVAENILYRLGFAGMGLNQLVSSLRGEQEQEETFLSRPAFFGTYVQIKQFDVSIVLNPIIFGNELLGFLLIVSDLTLIKKKEKELMEKSTVIKEIHHRVKNNLQTITSLLRLQMRRTNLKLVETVFTESINRILSIALIHEALSKQDLEVVNIKQTSFNILQMILSNMVDPSKKINGEISGDDIYLSATAASSVSLCITELIQNAVEHAFANRTDGNIRVAVEQTQEHIIISVKDNGVGISPAKIQNESSLGMQIVNTIIQHKLKGDFSIEGQRYGTVACIRFPKSNIEVIEA
ncbi:sensor histidine kinase [Candidatus Formimonas warabiya]|uniref:histidine kinase n=1 Tax=Formimonas warabiya TaxID=1761012 RepID=A0A3G1KS51_FORW1|nr:sensor histidine kinase [Candidatus Formimonas warabiya]ATW25333.1 hypothetical protein DCMF_11635 [Candidatus Formimonas warabiya]